MILSEEGQSSDITLDCSAHLAVVREAAWRVEVVRQLLAADHHSQHLCLSQHCLCSRHHHWQLYFEGLCVYAMLLPISLQSHSMLSENIHQSALSCFSILVQRSVLAFHGMVLLLVINPPQCSWGIFLWAFGHEVLFTQPHYTLFSQ